MDIVKKLRNFYFRIFEGINLEIFNSGEEGIWYYHGNKVHTILFLRLLIVNPDVENLIKLLSILGYGEEVIGFNDCLNRCFLEIRRSGFSAEERKQVKKRIMNWMYKKEIKGILFVG